MPDLDNRTAIHDLVVHFYREVGEQRFDAVLFDRWYRLFVESVDSGWSGNYADRAKSHAAHMAGVLSRRLTDRS